MCLDNVLKALDEILSEDELFHTEKDYDSDDDEYETFYRVKMTPQKFGRIAKKHGGVRWGSRRTYTWRAEDICSVLSYCRSSKKVQEEEVYVTFLIQVMIPDVLNLSVSYKKKMIDTQYPGTYVNVEAIGGVLRSIYSQDESEYHGAVGKLADELHPLLEALISYEPLGICGLFASIDHNSNLPSEGRLELDTWEQRSDRSKDAHKLLTATMNQKTFSAPIGIICDNNQGCRGYKRKDLTSLYNSPFWKANSTDQQEIREEVTDDQSVQCQICLERKINTALSCGHLFCHSCLETHKEHQSRNENCPVCKTRSYKRLRVFV